MKFCNFRYIRAGEILTIETKGSKVIIKKCDKQRTKEGRLRKGLETVDTIDGVDEFASGFQTASMHIAQEGTFVRKPARSGRR